MAFGPLTVSHPTLSLLPGPEAEPEIADSWRRLREELVRPDPIFCYPNGGPGDVGAREIAACRAARLTGAVARTAGYADPADFRAMRDAPYRVARFEMPERLGEVARHASGFTRLEWMLSG